MDDDQDRDQIDKDPEEEQDEETQRRPPSRFDRLASAKDKAEKEASRWSEIEDLGLPVESRDQTQSGLTQPIEWEEPPGKEDTPAGQHTPAKGQPPLAKEDLPPFPHPTDQQFPPPRSSGPGRPGARPEHPTDPKLPPEPPVPPGLDSPLPQQKIVPPDESSLQRYQPPPEELDEVRLDSDGMPLPRQVPHEDMDATMVSRSAFRDDVVMPPAPRTEPHGYSRIEDSEEPPQAVSGRRAPPIQPRPLEPGDPSYRPPLPPAQRAMPVPEKPTRPKRRQKVRFSWSCLLRLVVLSFVGGIVIAMLGGVGASIYYAQVTAPSFREIRDITDLQEKALQFETTRIRDRDGNVLYELNDPEGGFRDYVTIDEISPWVIHATVATEERGFFVNPGFSIPGIIRAVYQNYQEGEVVSGASTITQQLTRALLLPEEERYAQSYERKIKEIFLAAELGRRFDKTEILELYLNQAFYGNYAYGIEAAAQTYFNKSASELTLAEASFLAGIPQAPAVWDPVRDKEAALVRQQQVLALMLEAGCIDMGNTVLENELPCVTSVEIEAAQADLAAVAAKEFFAPEIQAKYPHWVVYVQQQLEKDPAIGPAALYTSGFDVYTTLDPNLQDFAQNQVQVTLAGLADRNVGNGSVVIIDVDTGAILAMVGSKDFDDESIDGQVNVALTPQQPGSSIKPFTYLTAFRQGWTPATVIWDVPISYEIPGYGLYEPVNYDEKFRGPVSVREAIANSLNIPAVLTLDHVGVPALLETLNDLHITSLGDETNPNQFGLSLTLGAGEVYLLEWTNAFATIANGGVYHEPYAIERIEINGEVIEGYPHEVPPGEQAIDPVHAYLLQSILSDKETRIPAFGENTPISPPYPAGAKTGTTNDFRDNWTMGFTTEIAVGVWVGNTDNTPMFNVTGVTGAGPIWRAVMDASQEWYPAQQFPQPPGVITETVCEDDGAKPSEFCGDRTYQEIFAADNPPPEASDAGLYRKLRVDKFTGLIANEYCPNYAEEESFLVIPNPSQLIDVPAFARDWLLNTDNGRAWAAARSIELENFGVPPEEACGPDTPVPELFIEQPLSGSEQSGLLTIVGTVNAPNFSHYIVEFGLGPDPQGWITIQGDTSQTVHSGPLAQVDLSETDNGPVTIRLVVYDQDGNNADVRVTFNVSNPTPTPTPTPTATEVVTPTPTLNLPTKTSTSTPTEEGGGVPTPTPTETPTLTPTTDGEE